MGRFSENAIVFIKKRLYSQNIFGADFMLNKILSVRNSCVRGGISCYTSNLIGNWVSLKNVRFNQNRGFTFNNKHTCFYLCACLNWTSVFLICKNALIGLSKVKGNKRIFFISMTFLIKSFFIMAFLE